jgi:hypothetical protein
LYQTNIGNYLTDNEPCGEKMRLSSLLIFVVTIAAGPSAYASNDISINLPSSLPPPPGQADGTITAHNLVGQFGMKIILSVTDVDTPIEQTQWSALPDGSYRTVIEGAPRVTATFKINGMKCVDKGDRVLSCSNNSDQPQDYVGNITFSASGGGDAPAARSLILNVYGYLNESETIIEKSSAETLWLPANPVTCDVMAPSELNLGEISPERIMTTRGEELGWEAQISCDSRPPHMSFSLVGPRGATGDDVIHNANNAAGVETIIDDGTNKTIKEGISQTTPNTEKLQTLKFRSFLAAAPGEVHAGSIEVPISLSIRYY